MTKFKFGCCPSHAAANDELECCTCKVKFHYGCIESSGNSVKSYKDLTKDFKRSWVCPTCLSKRPKVNQSSTPIGSDSSNVTFRSKHQVDLNQSGDIADMRLLIHEEMSSLLDELKSHILQQFDLHSSEVLCRLTNVDDSLKSLQQKYDSVKKDFDEKVNIITNLESENKELKSTVVNLNSRLSQLEQHSRSSNVEIQCIPEFKSENLFKTVKQIASIVNYKLNEADIHLCTRISKLNKESKRPRSVVVKFSSPRVRDEFLAATITFNRKAATSADKLNSSHLGVAGERRPVYVGEHLSPAIKAVHAAARIKAKELNYKFVWVRRGTVYMRQTETAEYRIIKSIESLCQLEPTGNSKT